MIYSQEILPPNCLFMVLAHGLLGYMRRTLIWIQNKTFKNPQKSAYSWIKNFFEWAACNHNFTQITIKIKFSNIFNFSAKYSLILLSWKAKWLGINFLISEVWAERDLLHSTSLSLALDRPRLYLLLPTPKPVKETPDLSAEFQLKKIEVMRMIHQLSVESIWLISPSSSPFYKL